MLLGSSEEGQRVAARADREMTRRFHAHLSDVADPERLRPFRLQLHGRSTADAEAQACEESQGGGRPAWFHVHPLVFTINDRACEPDTSTNETDDSGAWSDKVMVISVETDTI
jgi:hypothetical protein